MSLECTRTPCDNAYRRIPHDGAHFTDCGWEPTPGDFYGTPRWAITTHAEPKEPWAVRLQVGEEAIIMPPKEVARFMESLMKGWHRMSEARENEARVSHD